MTCDPSHSLYVIVALERNYLHLACRTYHLRWFRLVCMNWFVRYRLSRTGHVRWFWLAHHFILIYSTWLTYCISVMLDMAYTWFFTTLEYDFYLYVLLYFLGNFMGFTVRGYYFWKGKLFLKSFVFAHSRFQFCTPPGPLGSNSKVFVSTRIRGIFQHRWLPMTV